MNVGEKANGQSVDLSPGATIRAATSSVTLQQGMHTYRVVVPTDSATANPPASIGNVMPFRYAEVLNSPVALTASAASQVAVTYPYDASASSFASSNAALDPIWNLSKHTIFATTFAGIYIDGDPSEHRTRPTRRSSSWVTTPSIASSRSRATATNTC